MYYTEIHFKNPINFISVDQLMDEIKSCISSLLIINIGEHNFESIEIIKELKNKLSLEKDTLSRFRRIALLHPPDFKNKSDDEERYNFSSNKKAAIDWLMTT